MNKRVLLTSLVIFLSGTALSSGLALAQKSTAKPDPANNLIFIFDGSTSMWGRIDGEPKLVIAKNAMKDLVDQLPEQTNASLMSYGHRVEKDCTDVEAIVPLQPLVRKEFKQQIQSINPRGRTPISYALQQALAMLPGTQETTSIILLTDGIENCEGDPCAVVKTAQSQGLNFNLQVIGFDVPKQDTEDLQCSASAGNGQYLSADNAAQLVSALDAATDPAKIAVAQTNQTTKTPIPKSAATAKATSQNLIKQKSSTQTISTTTDNKVALAADSTKSTAKEEPNQTQEKQAQEKPAKEKQAQEKLAKEKQAQEKMAKEKQAQEKLAQEKLAQEKLVQEKMAKEKQAQEKLAKATTPAATSADVSLKAPDKIDAGTIFSVNWSGPGEAWDYITMVEADAAEGSYTQYIYAKEGNPLTIQAPATPGDYEIRYVQGNTQSTLNRIKITVQ